MTATASISRMSKRRHWRSGPTTLAIPASSTDRSRDACRQPKTHPLSLSDARRIWLAAQRLDIRAPFGDGPQATPAAVAHLGYVQIDTINVIERCHHHILYTRIPAYERAHLRQAQSVDKTVFEYWTHALSYVATRDLHFFLADMKHHRTWPMRWFNSVKPEEVRSAVARVRKEGPLSIRDIDDDELVEKDHPWASRKPSKRALQYAFFAGTLAVSARAGMLKTYELIGRHFGWEKPPKAASERQTLDYMLDRALRSQGITTLDSASNLEARRKPGMRKLIEARVRRGELVTIAIDGAKTPFFARPETLAAVHEPDAELVHILSPFDPLIIQRKRLNLLFGYEHRFEAYVPKEKRVFGYFALPVLVGDEIVAALDLKTDRENGKLLIQKWTWVGSGTASRHKRLIEEELGRFEQFQLATE